MCLSRRRLTHTREPHQTKWFCERQYRSKTAKIWSAARKDRPRQMDERGQIQSSSAADFTDIWGTVDVEACITSVDGSPSETTAAAIRRSVTYQLFAGERKMRKTPPIGSGRDLAPWQRKAQSLLHETGHPMSDRSGIRLHPSKPWDTVMFFPSHSTHKTLCGGSPFSGPLDRVFERRLGHHQRKFIAAISAEYIIRPDARLQ